jgi:aspartate carbamoyltransferase catalytic subunit
MPTDNEYDGIPHLATIDDAIDWADIINLLRIQRERIGHDVVPSVDEYRARYAMTSERMRMAGDIILTHPGPVNLGVEIDAEVLDDDRSLIHRQVTHGVAVRMAVLRRVIHTAHHA